MEIIRFANVLSSKSDRYIKLMGKPDTRLIMANPGPNAALRAKQQQRIDTSIKRIIELYKREKITIEPIDEIFEVNEKKMKVNLGNFTAPINLTYGERTGSCMRIGGQAETLYNFCQENENGFHIRITDPQTGKLISRVSGFRNGNSVFLNELRYSLIAEKYSDSDLVELIKIVSESMVERSQNSSSKIENVFVSIAYATKKSDLKVVTITENIKQGLPNFYFDIINSAGVLYTTSIDGYTQINTDKTNLPKYPVLRSPIRTLEREEYAQEISRIHLLKVLLETGDINKMKTCELQLVDENSIIKMISGEDWYIYLDVNYHINCEYIERNGTIAEMQYYLEILKEEVKEYETTNGSNKRL